MNAKPLNSQKARPPRQRHYNSTANGVLVENLRRTHKVALQCDAMGLEILNIDSQGGKIAIEVANNFITREMMKNGMAFANKRACDQNGRYTEAKIVLHGVRVFWKDYEHPVFTTRPQY